MDLIVITRKRQDFGLIALACRAVAMLHTDNLQQLIARVTHGIAHLWRDIATNEITHQRGHQVSEVHAGTDTPFGIEETARTILVARRKSRRFLRSHEDSPLG